MICIKAPTRTEAAVSPLKAMQSQAISIEAHPLLGFLSRADTPNCHGTVSGPLPNLQVLVFPLSSRLISPKLISFQPSRASSFQTDGVPPACFLARGQAPLTRLRSGRAEPRLLVSSVEDKPLSCVFVPDRRSPARLFPQSRTSPSRVSSFRPDRALFACFLGRGQASLARLRSRQTESYLLASSIEDKPLLRLAALTSRSTTVKMSAQAGSPNCSVDNRQNVCLGWQP